MAETILRRIAGRNVSGDHLEHYRENRVTFYDCCFDRVIFDKCAFENVQFARCSFEATIFRSSFLRDVDFWTSAGQIELEDTSIDRVIFPTKDWVVRSLTKNHESSPGAPIGPCGDSQGVFGPVGETGSAKGSLGGVGPTGTKTVPTALQQTIQIGAKSNINWEQIAACAREIDEMNERSMIDRRRDMMRQIMQRQSMASYRQHPFDRATNYLCGGEYVCDVNGDVHYRGRRY